ncbi:MAG: hypothetical protein QHH00_03595 [Methanomassiliicoccales archaeon]|jgi:hypothetical protein|nr:hypothetical protein [Methanomassiliicoccales archaeon]
MLTPDFSAYAAKVQITSDHLRTGSEMQKVVENLMSRSVIECVKAGASLIGHAKCIAESDSGHYLTCSVTDNDGKARCKGSLGTNVSKMELVINILLYGLNRVQVEEIFKRVLEEETNSKGFMANVEDIDVRDDEHDHEHHGHEHPEDNHNDSH